MFVTIITIMLEISGKTQPKIGFKTRYGMVANPFVGASAGNDTGTDRANQYYRIFKVEGILGS